MTRATDSGGERQRWHAVSFDDPDVTVAAVRTLRSEGYGVADVYTPFAVHGMDEALGLAETRLPWATFVGGALGLGLGMGFQLWTHAVDWPLNIGGKTNVAWEALVPVAFEVTVLLAAFATVGALLFKGKLFPRGNPDALPSQPSLRVTDDRFVVVVTETDASFSLEEFNALCTDLGAESVTEGWRVK